MQGGRVGVADTRGRARASPSGSQANFVVLRRKSIVRPTHSARSLRALSLRRETINSCFDPLPEAGLLPSAARQGKHDTLTAL